MSPPHPQQGIGAEDRRVDEIVVDAPIEDVHALEPLGGEHVDEPLGDHQILALHQLHPHLLGEEGVFEVGAVVNAGGQDADGGRLDVFRCEVLQGLQQLGGVIVHRPHPGGFEHLGEGALEHLAILQHVGDARGAAQVVLQHVEAAVVVAHQVGARHVAPYPAGRGEALAFFAVGAAGEDQVFGDHLVLEDLFLVVNVLDELIEGEDPLLEAAFDLLPVAGGNDAGNDVERENLFGALIAAVDVEGNAHFKQQGLGRLLAHGEVARRQRLDLVHQQLRAGSGPAVAVDQFIVIIPRIVSSKCLHRTFSSIYGPVCGQGCRPPDLKAFSSGRKGGAVWRY